MPRHGDVIPLPPRRSLSRASCSTDLWHGTARQHMLLQRSAGASREAPSVGTGALDGAWPVSHSGSRRVLANPPHFRGFPWHGSEQAGSGRYADLSLKEACGAKGIWFKSWEPVADGYFNRGACNWGQPCSPRFPAWHLATKATSCAPEKFWGI